MPFVATVPAQSLATSDVGWIGNSIRQRFEGAVVSQSGTAIKVRVKAGAGGATFSTVYAGHAGTGAAFDGTQVQLTFSGAASLVMAANAAVWSDAVPYTVTAGSPLIVAGDCTAGGTLARRTPADSNYNFYYKVGTGAATTSGSGFSVSGSTTLLVEQIQVEQTGGGGGGPSGGGDLVGIGDSVTAPARAGAWSLGEGWLALLAAETGMTERNLAVSGMNTAQMQPQWDAALAMGLGRGDLIIVMPGENDIPGTPVASMQATLDAQVASAVIAGVPVTLVTPWIYDHSSYLPTVRDYVQAIKTVAAKYRMPCVDVFEAICTIKVTDPALYSTLCHPDGHPTIAGHAWVKSLFALPQHTDVPLCHCGGW
jgi:lysophospholipase L1-like esterase